MIQTEFLIWNIIYLSFFLYNQSVGLQGSYCTALRTERLCGTNEEKYDAAKENLENCLKYASSEDFIDDTFYYLGQIAQEKNDVATAQLYYQRILDEYPDSNHAANAQNALEQLNSPTPE